MQKIYNHPLVNNNTFGINAVARLFIEYDSVEELQTLIAELPALKTEIGSEKVLHIGGGSNLLFTGNFDGIILHSRIGGIELTEEDDESVVLRVGATVVWDDLVAYAVEKGWSGIENLSLIPGETGSAAVQNIGAYGAEAKDVIVTVETIELATGKPRVFKNSECGYAYRQSIFKNSLKGKYAVTYVNIRLDKHFAPNINYGDIRKALDDKEITPASVRQAIIDTRNQKLPDPKVLGNAGSFFMNPVVSQEKFEELKAQYPDMPFYQLTDGVKIPAGWLIEQSGWKGRSLGKAAVHDKQALVLVNLGGAEATDIVRLSDEVRNTVKSKFGIDIHPEVNFI